MTKRWAATSSRRRAWRSGRTAGRSSRSASAPRRPRRSRRAAASLGAGVRRAVRRVQAGLEGVRPVTEQAAHREARRLTAAERKRLEDEYYLSANVLKASEDKTFPGAIVASLASPWGQAVSAGDPANTYFGSYREVFARDLYETWTGLVADGDLATARAATLFLFERQQLPDGSMPRNSLVNGKPAPDSFGTQLDEVAYPILMAAAARAHRRRAVREPHQAGRELPDLARPLVRIRALGGTGGLLALDDRRRDRRASPRRPTWPASTATRPRPRSGSASPTTGSAR